MKGGSVIWLFFALVLRFLPMLDLPRETAISTSTTSAPSPPKLPDAATTIDPDG